MDIREAIARISGFENLTAQEMEQVLRDIVEGKATEAQIGAFIVASKMKEETPEEIEGAARVFRELSTKVEVNNPEEVVDTCGTGGDSSGTFNVSTVTAFVLAGAGIKVAKHGNRSVSSKCGSADFLEQVGAKIDLPPEKVSKMIEEVGIGFMFAPIFHPAMKKVVKPRREVGVRSIFNLVGPLSNPARAKRQLLGVFSERLVEKLSKVLHRLGILKAYVVHGRDGIDEVSVSDSTLVGEVSQNGIRLFEFSPEELGIKRQVLKEVCIMSPEESVRLGVSVLEKEEGTHRDIVLLNAAFGILASGKVRDLKEAFETAKESVDSGRAKRKLEEFIEVSNRI